jgi:hypothetical protein
MNKYAAEKIAQDYYALGMQIAMEQGNLSKTAGLGDKIVKGTAGLYGGLGGGMLGLKAMADGGVVHGRDLGNALEGLVKLNPGQLGADELVALGIAGPAGIASAILGAKGATKGYAKLKDLLSNKL